MQRRSMNWSMSADRSLLSVDRSLLDIDWRVLSGSLATFTY